jgi:hypothetical protein
MTPFAEFFDNFFRYFRALRFRHLCSVCLVEIQKQTRPETKKGQLRPGLTS